MGALIRRLLWLPVVLTLSGCWDIHYIENINYITALGFDYADNQFIAYGQMLDFSSVAKQEGSRKSTTPAVTWVGKGKGETFNMALNDFYRTAQQRILWSQITSIVITDRALAHGTDEFNDAITRYREIRFTPWVYATKEPMDQLFVTPAFFNLSELSTIEHEPIQNYKQRSWIKPISYLQFASDIHEPGKTVIVPSITINHSQWKRNDAKESKMMVNGAYFITKDHYLGALNENQLEGLRWMTPETVRSPILIPAAQDSVDTLSLEHPKPKISTSFSSGEPTFSIAVELSGNVVELDTPMTETEMVKKAEAVVKQQIKQTYLAALKKKIDIYQLEYFAYKDHYQEWSKLTKLHPFRLSESSLSDIQVKVKLLHSGLLDEMLDEKIEGAK
ncbi:Ger(x)C family spore germination protein [Paenibacillus cremeus]|uniref:Ger(X)C family spore germination protein n=1 Tax=Paenibacillus cremeus TaxID=2163881 RepID=A0A559K9U3_9BACL|nr:Ger(x)C family spore germination protein [Paenibacillus cremeus]TVY08908.1 Ger(x)C family spore germination protein [Paenibacillus cremeus]